MCLCCYVQDPVTGTVRPTVTGQPLDQDDADADEDIGADGISKEEMPDLDIQTRLRSQTGSLQEIPLRN